MKNIIFEMTSKFCIKLLSKSAVYELENYASKLIFNTDVDAGMEYKLHIKNDAEKLVVLLDKEEGALSFILTSDILKQSGVYSLQIEGIKEDKRIISNIVNIDVNLYINAQKEPTPEEKSIIDQILVKVGIIESDIDIYAKETERNINRIDNALNDVNSDLSSIQNNINILNNDIDNVIDEQEALSRDIAGINNNIDEINRTLDTHSLDISNLTSELNKKADAVEVLSQIGDVASDLDEEISNRIASEALLMQDIESKQKKLAAGKNITITEDGTISAFGGGGGGGSNVTISDNPEGGIDLTVDSTSKVIAKQSDLKELNKNLTHVKADLSERPSDVQINGTSILDDNKVANIPISREGILGVIKPARGFVTYADGTPACPELSLSQYNSTFSSTFIGKGTLENRLAPIESKIGGDYELIADVTTEEAVGIIRVSLTKKCKEVLFFINDSLTATFNPAFNIYILNNNKRLTAFNSTTGIRRIQANFKFENNILFFNGSIQADNRYVGTQNFFNQIIDLTDIFNENSICEIRGDWNGSIMFPVGLNVKVYGRQGE